MPLLTVKDRNFQVEDYHTYHVGNNGVLVHNAGADYGQRTIEVNGKKVTLDDSSFDPNYVDPKTGKTNLQLMQDGYAPYGPDGKKVNIHHIDQTNNGPVMEITASEHQQNYSKLHSNIGQSSSKIDRNTFAKWRKDFWKWRSNN